MKESTVKNGPMISGKIVIGPPDKDGYVTLYRTDGSVVRRIGIQEAVAKLTRLEEQMSMLEQLMSK